jgi:hypothetical protein
MEPNGLSSFHKNPSFRPIVSQITAGEAFQYREDPLGYPPIHAWVFFLQVPTLKLYVFLS